MRAPIVLVTLAALGVAGLWAGKTFAPCSAPMAAVLKLGGAAATCPAQPAAAAEAPREIEPPAITVASAKKREFVDRLFVSGSLVAREEAQVPARLDGLTIVEVDAEDGDHVKVGQVLARLDRSQLDAMLAENDAAIARADAAIAQSRSNIAQSESLLGFASDDFDRAKKLGNGVMSVATVEQRETNLKSAQAQLAAANNALAVSQADRGSRDAERKELLVRISRTDVRAPVSGIVSRRLAKPGAMASLSGDALFRIIVDGAIDLEADVPEQYLARLGAGMPAALKLPGATAAVAGEVRLVNQEVDKASRTGKVRIALKDVTHARIGAFASGEVDLARRDGVGAPSAALRRDGDDARLMVVRDGRVEERKVAPGIVEGDAVEIRSGLAAGEVIVARAAAFLRPGDRVRPMAEGG